MSTYKYRKLLPYIALAVFIAVSVITLQHYEKSAMEQEEHHYNEYVTAYII